jgi:hypothetical protein
MGQANRNEAEPTPISLARLTTRSVPSSPTSRSLASETASKMARCRSALPPGSRGIRGEFQNRSMVQPSRLASATLDHYVPVSKGGGNDADNLRTCCLMCNSIKSGHAYEEVAPLLLASVRDRRKRPLVDRSDD